MQFSRLFDRKLTKISEISLQWSEAVALFKTVGERLNTLYLSLDGRGAVWDNNVENPDNHQHMIPKFEEIMARCPNVQKLTLSFGIKATQVCIVLLVVIELIMLEPNYLNTC